MKLFSRIMGEGQPILIVHGLFGMSDNWQSLGKKFADFNGALFGRKNSNAASSEASRFSSEIDNS